MNDKQTAVVFAIGRDVGRYVHGSIERGRRGGGRSGGGGGGRRQWWWQGGVVGQRDVVAKLNDDVGKGSGGGHPGGAWTPTFDGFFHGGEFFWYIV